MGVFLRLSFDSAPIFRSRVSSTSSASKSISLPPRINKQENSRTERTVARQIEATVQMTTMPVWPFLEIIIYFPDPNGNSTDDHHGVLAR
jgi:hypothetical protein